MSSSDKFVRQTTIPNKSQEVRNFFEGAEGLIVSSKMSDSMKPIIGNIALSYGNVNEEKIISLLNDGKITEEEKNYILAL